LFLYLSNKKNGICDIQEPLVVIEDLPRNC